MPEQIKAGRRWRKKPVVIEAERWDGTVAGATRLIDWLLARHATARYHDATDPGEAGNRLAIDTLEGTMTAQPGDWIICGVQGEFYPCKPDVFEATYEPVAEGEPRA